LEAVEGWASLESGQVSLQPEAVYVQIAGLFYLTSVHDPVFKQGAHDAVR
jgi:hypothetical protein